MKFPGRSRILALLLSLVAVVAAALPAQAEALEMGRDRSDNTHYFEYDPASGEIGKETSSLIIRRRDPVTFIVMIREVPGAAEGARLAARFSLALNRNRPVRYVGAFSVVVRDALGSVVAREEVDRKIVLRPKRGHRRARFSMRFDLDVAGSYEASGHFNPS